jgi:uncharacterized protein YbjT (DUF2867 family)
MAFKILVTGATGAVGREVVKELRAKMATVRAAVHNPATAAALGWQGVETVPLDYARPDTFAPALEGVNHVFLVRPPVGSPGMSNESFFGFIDQAKRGGVEHIVSLATMGTEQNDAFPMRQVEKHLEASGVGFTFLRPNWFMQNFSGAIAETINKMGTIFLPAGDGKTSFIDVRDVGAAAAVLLTEPGHMGKAYAPTGGQALDHHEVAAILSRVSGKTINYAPLSDDDMRSAMKGAGMPGDAIEGLLMLYRPVRRGQAAVVTPDLPKLIDRPPITFEQYARDYSASWK